MSEVYLCGAGAVSAAGWGVAPFAAALAHGEPLPSQLFPRPGQVYPILIRPVKPPSPRPAFASHPRLRRASPIAMHAVGAGLEALGEDIARYQEGPGQLGVILCVMSGSVNYSRRFYDEVLKDPGTASPLVFPETVFNSPASHLAAVLGVTGINYTLVGDPGTFLQGLALAADWLLAGQVEGCLVIGAEEIDWLTTEACYLFERNTVVADGAGALYLRRQTNQKPAVRLRTVTQSHLFSKVQSRAKAAKRARAEIVTPAKDHLLCDGIQGMPVIDRAEKAAWSDWPGPRVSPKLILGEGLMAGAAWQCVAAFNALQTGKFPAATVSVVGSNQQAIAAQFVA